MKDGSAALKEKPQLDDDELRGMIEERLDDDPAFRLRSGRRASFEVDVDDGQVMLRGVVPTALARRKADIMARGLGATTVDNRLRIEEKDAPLPPRRSGGQRRLSLPGSR